MLLLTFQKKLSDKFIDAALFSSEWLKKHVYVCVLGSRDEKNIRRLTSIHDHGID